MNIFVNPAYFDSSESFTNPIPKIDNIQENLQNSTKNTKYQYIDEDNEDYYKDMFEHMLDNVSNNNKYFYSNNDNEQIYYQTKKTEPSTQHIITKPKNRIFNIKKIERIFSIKKTERNGRKKGRFSLGKHPSYKPKHDKYFKDNIILKIKRYFVNSTLKYINQKYNEYLNLKKKKNKPLLKKITTDFYKVYSTEANQGFLNLYIYQLFSKDLSDKITKFSKDYNRNQIKLLYEKNKAKEVIEIMNLKVKNMYEIYISNEIFDYNFENDLISIIKEKDEQDEEIKQEETDKYKNRVKDIANNLIDFINRKEINK